jgi:TP901 family phage tail tape measure protein
VAKSYKGITITFEADTTNLKTALGTVENKAKSLEAELRQINKALKLDPGNSELLSQKYELLSRSITAAQTRLKALRAAENEVQKAFERDKAYKDTYLPLKEQVAQATAKLRELSAARKEARTQYNAGNIGEDEYKKLCAEVKEASQALKALRAQQREVANSVSGDRLNEEQYRAYRRELQRAEISLRSLNAEMERTKEAQAGNINTSGANQLSNGLNTASTAAGNLARQTGQASTAMKELQADAKKIGQTLVKAFTAVATALSVVMAKATQVGADFEEAMAEVVATMGIDTAANDYEILADKAKELGAATKFTATEAANALQLLAQAGYDTTQQLKAVPEVLNLAASGKIELAHATKICTTSMAALGLTVNDLQSFTDKVAVAAQATNSKVSSLGEGFTTVGGTAKMLAGGLTETATALGILSDAGIEGEEGGTSLRQIILNLMNPSREAATTLQELGVSAFNADGSIKPLNETFEQLSNAMSGFTDKQKMNAMGDIFDVRQLKSANALLANYGERWQYLTDKINNSEGAAKKMADTMNDNLKGDITILKSALEGLGIAVSEDFNGAFRSAVKQATEAFSQINASIENGQLGKRLDDISTAFGALISRITDFALNSALPATIDAFEWILTNGETIKNTVVAIGTAFVTWKVTKIFGNLKTVIAETAVRFQTATTAAQKFFAIMSAPTAATVAVTAATTAVVALIGHFKELQALEEEASRKRADSAEAATTELKNITELTAEYEALKNVSDKTSEQEKQFSDLQEQITAQLGERAKALEGLTVGTQEYIDTLDKVIGMETENQITAINAGLEDTRKQLSNLASSDAGVKKLANAVSSALVNPDFENGYSLTQKDLERFTDSATGNLNIVIAQYRNFQNEIEKTNKTISDLEQAGDIESANAIRQSESYRMMSDSLKSIEQPLSTYLSQVAQLAEYSYKTQNGHMPQTVEEQQELQRLFESMTNISSEYSDVLRDIVTDYVAIGKSARNAVQAVQEVAIDTSAIANQMSTTVTSVKDNASTVASAVKEFSDSGEISADTALKLIESGYALAIQWDEEQKSCVLLTDKVDELTEAKYKKVAADLQEKQVALQKEYDAESKSIESLRNNINSLAEAKEYYAKLSAFEQTGKDLEDAKAYAKAFNSAMQAQKTDTAASTATKSNTDEAKEQLDALETLYSVGKIEAIDYYEQLSRINDTYYKNNAEKASEYQKNLEKIYSGTKEIYKQNFETESDWLEYYYMTHQISTEQYLSEMTSLTEKYYGGQREFAKEYNDYMARIEKARINAKIESLQAEKSALQQENEESQRAIDLEQARIDLENIRNNRKRIYTSETGFSYEQDKQGIQSAEQKVNNILLEQQLDAYDRLIEALQANADAVKTMPTGEVVDMATVQARMEQTMTELVNRSLEVLKLPDISNKKAFSQQNVQNDFSINFGNISIQVEGGKNPEETVKNLEEKIAGVFDEKVKEFSRNLRLAVLQQGGN